MRSPLEARGAEAERRALEAAKKGPAEVEEVMRVWVRELEKGGRGSGFRNAFLQSRALELILETIAMEPSLRRHFAQAQAWTSFGIRGLLGQTMDCSEDVWSSIVRCAFGESELISEPLAQLTAQLVGAVKAGAAADAVAQRVALSERADALSKELERLCEQELGERSSAHARRVGKSGELLGVYRAVAQSIDESVQEESEARRALDDHFAHLDSEAQAYVQALTDPAKGLAQRNKSLQAGLQTSHDDLQAELHRIEDERSEMDKAIEDFEATKRQCREELDNLNTELKATQAEQRRHMQQCDDKHSVLNSIEAEFRAKIRVEDDAIYNFQRERSAIERTLNVVTNVEAKLDKSLNNQVEELLRRQTQFDLHFVEILRDHVAFQDQHLSELEQEAEACAESVAKHRAKIEMLNVMDMSTKSVVDAEDRKRLERLLDSADAAVQEIHDFRHEYSDLVAGTEAETLLRDIARRHQALQHTLGPCRDLVPGREAPCVLPAESVVPAYALPRGALTTTPILSPSPRMAASHSPDSASSAAASAAATPASSLRSPTPPPPRSLTRARTAPGGEGTPLQLYGVSSPSSPPGAPGAVTPPRGRSVTPPRFAPPPSAAQHPRRMEEMEDP